MPADSSALRSLFIATARRLRWADLALGAAIGLVISAALNFVGWPGRGGPLPPLYAGLLGTVETAVFVAAIRTRWRPAAAVAVERATPESRNLLFTAAELLGIGGRAAGHKPFPLLRAFAGMVRRLVTSEAVAASPPIGASTATLRIGTPSATLVLDAAAALAARLEPARIVPLARHTAMVVAAAVIWLTSVARVTEGTLVGRATSPIPMVDAVEFTVTPPAYTKRATQKIRNPDRLTVLEGSRIGVSVSSNAATVVLGTRDSATVMSQSGREGFAGFMIAKADGFITAEPRAADGIVGERRLVGLTVVADSAPRARVVAPGKDLIVADGKRSVDLAAEATDDIGVTSLRLRYTVVSGSGERFEFKEGTLPLVIDSSRSTRWTARAKWNLESLGLEPGDMVVYRAVAGDARPGPVPTAVESDAYIIEVASPGGVAAAGFAVDPEQERYAVSQQMVILKSERLLKKRSTTLAQAYADEAAEIAAEQRRVRAEFVFMLGGEMGTDPAADTASTDINEVDEANREDDLVAGREAMGGRVAVLTAIRAMARASRSLTDVDVATALTHERAALKQLELAFSRTRIILRALSERERLDSTRRLTGDFTDATNSRRPAATPVSAARVTELRAVLSGILALVQRPASGPASALASALAARVLQVGPGERELQNVSSALSAAATAITASRPVQARAQLQRAAAAINAQLILSLPSSSADGSSLDAARARGALSELLSPGKP